MVLAEVGRRERRHHVIDADCMIDAVCMIDPVA
jgi:hypothetical protein